MEKSDGNSLFFSYRNTILTLNLSDLIMHLFQTPISILIIGITVIFSLKAFKDNDFKYKWIYYPYNVQHHKEWYRIFTHILLHGDSMHLFFNMFVLYSFGTGLEFLLRMHFGTTLGSAHFFVLYLLGGVAASIWPFVRNKDNPNYMSLGASGAVSAVLFAMILWRPESGVYLFFIPYEIPAWLFGILYLIFEFYMSYKKDGKIAHDAHFGGAIFGICYVLFINFPKGLEFIHYILN